MCGNKSDFLLLWSEMVSGLFEKRNLCLWWYGLGKPHPKKCREADLEKKQVQGRSGCSLDLSHWAWIRSPAVLWTVWSVNSLIVLCPFLKTGAHWCFCFFYTNRLSCVLASLSLQAKGLSSDCWLGQELGRNIKSLNLVEWRFLPDAPLRRGNLPCLWRVQYPQMTSVVLN